MTATTVRTGDPEGCWQALMVLAVAMLFGMTTWFSATAVVPQLRALCSLTNGETAWLTIAVQLGFVAGALTSALLNIADRIAPRRLMCLGAILAIGYVLTVPTLWLIPVVQGLAGWAAAFGVLAIGPVIGTLAMSRLAAIEAANTS